MRKEYVHALDIEGLFWAAERRRSENLVQADPPVAAPDAAK
jgi:hypothetical protein